MKDSKEELQKVSDFYGSDFDKGQLEAQLLVFKSKFKELKKEKVVLKDIIDFMSKPGHFAILSEISTVGSYLFLFNNQSLFWSYQLLMLHLNVFLVHWKELKHT